MMNHKPEGHQSGLFITFEGGEGAGKSTLIQKVSQQLQQRNFQVLSTREPGGSELGEQVRQWLLSHRSSEKVSLRAELLLFLAARAQHIENLIKPALAAGKIVLCDRFNDSTIAYQGVARNLGFEVVESLCQFASDDLDPQLTFFLDVDPIEGLHRTRSVNKENANAGELDRIESEKLDFHQRVRAGMHQLAARYPERINIVDAHQTQEQVFQTVLKKIESYV